MNQFSVYSDGPIRGGKNVQVLVEYFSVDCSPPLEADSRGLIDLDDDTAVAISDPTAVNTDLRVVIGGDLGQGLLMHSVPGVPERKGVKKNTSQK